MGRSARDAAKPSRWVQGLVRQVEQLRRDVCNLSSCVDPQDAYHRIKQLQYPADQSTEAGVLTNLVPADRRALQQ